VPHCRVKISILFVGVYVLHGCVRCRICTLSRRDSLDVGGKLATGLEARMGEETTKLDAHGGRARGKEGLNGGV